MSVNAFNPYTYTNGFKSGDFHHVAISISGTIHTLYLDGIQVAQNISGGNIFSYSSNIKNAIIGASKDRYNAFQGNIGDVRVYNYAINSTQVSNLYLDRNLVNYYKFNTFNKMNIPNYATLVYDASLVGNAIINNNTLYLQNTTNSSTSQYVYAVPPNIPRVTSGLTISAWINTNGIPNKLMRIFDITNNVGSPGISIDISGTNMINSSYSSNFSSTILPNATYGTINTISINDFGNMVMSTSVGIFYSYNFGKDWNISNANTSYNWVSISLINSGYALACTSSAVYLSTNSGKTWKITGAPTSGYTYSAITLSSSGYAMVLSNKISLNSSGDFSTWSQPSVITSNTSFGIFCINLSSNGVGIAGGNTGVSITKNNGTTWSDNGSVPFSVGTSISDNGAYMVANNTNSPGYLFYSTNSGDTWNTSNNAITNLAGNMAVGNNGKAFNYINVYPSPIYQTDLTKNKTLVSTGYSMAAANIAICPSGLFVSFIVANDVNSKKIIVKTT